MRNAKVELLAIGAHESKKGQSGIDSCSDVPTPALLKRKNRDPLHDLPGQ